LIHLLDQGVEVLFPVAKIASINEALSFLVLKSPVELDNFNCQTRLLAPLEVPTTASMLMSSVVEIHSTLL
jgi:hypothetical protein